MSRTLYMSRRAFTEPRSDQPPLPKCRTHAEFCSWLWTRGCLDPAHRACLASKGCVAHNTKTLRAVRS